MIAILDYGIGNLKSIYNMFKKIGVDAVITSNVCDVLEADKYILPGVGAFDYGIRSLKGVAFFEQLEEQVVVKKKPLLGICLGMQLLTNGSDEGDEQGLGWIDATTCSFDMDDINLSVPHMGWNKAYPSNVNDGLFAELADGRFYFVHSYHVVCESPENQLAATTYGAEFSSGIRKENIYGVQFHPEKSHKFGMKLFSNFASL